MKDLGYTERQNISAVYRFAEGALERLPMLAAEVVRLNVDVIVAPGSGAVAAKNATDRIPIVVTLGDPIGAGLVASLARPGGNVTGLSAFLPELAGKQLALLKEAFPGVSRVAVISRAGLDPNVLLLRNMKLVAERLHVTLQALELRSADEFESAFSAIKAERANAILTLRNPLSVTHRAQIVDFAARNRLPAMYPDKEFGEAGGLMSYGVNVADLWGRGHTPAHSSARMGREHHESPASTRPRLALGFGHGTAEEAHGKGQSYRGGLKVLERALQLLVEGLLGVLVAGFGFWVAVRRKALARAMAAMRWRQRPGRAGLPDARVAEFYESFLFATGVIAVLIGILMVLRPLLRRYWHLSI
jgi:hypothetical protein